MLGVYRNPANTGMAAYLGDDAFPSQNYHVPGVLKNYYGDSSSLMITNPTDLMGSVDIYLYNSSGALVSNLWRSLPARAGTEVALEDEPSLPSGRYLAHISSNTVPVYANIVTQGDTDNDRLYANNIDSYTSTSLFAPTVRKNHYGYYSSIVISNVSADNGTITVKIYPGARTVYSGTLNAKATLALNSANFVAYNGDYSVHVSGNVQMVGLVNTFNSTTKRFGSYSMTDWGASRYQSLPALWKNTPMDLPRLSSVKCMNTNNTTGKIRLTVLGGQYAESPSLTKYGSYEFILGNITNFPNHALYAGVAESMSGGSIYCVSTSNVASLTTDAFFQYEGVYTENNTNQNASTKNLVLYDEFQ
jgi:hypothetical protein